MITVESENAESQSDGPAGSLSIWSLKFVVGAVITKELLLDGIRVPVLAGSFSEALAISSTLKDWNRFRLKWRPPAELGFCLSS